jgi:hypothetical protein
LADGKHSESGDKNEEGAGNDAWSGEWENHVLKGFEGSGGEVVASGLGACHAGGDVVGFDEGKRAGEIAWGPAFG